MPLWGLNAWWIAAEQQQVDRCPVEVQALGPRKRAFGGLSLTLV